LYVMSYCPFWTQAEKPYLSIMKKFKDVADVDIKFVQYVMHKDQKEWEENLLQYCIKTTQKEKFVPYLECFLKDWKSKECLKSVWIDQAKIDNCIKETDKKFKISEKLNDNKKRFPDFDIDKETALKAWVMGSPTLVINGMKIEWVDRTEKGFAEVICKTFKNKPAICEDLSKFSTKAYKPWFWFEAPTDQSNTQAAAGCWK
jgi:protein-disulfide isomerase